MTDWELVEFAARAADIPVYESDDGTLQKRPIWVVKCGGGSGTMPYEWPWNPLVSDSDALQLMCSLQLCVAFIGMAVQVRPSTGGPLVTEVVYRGEPWAAALRRAITRAAAEIGKSLPSNPGE